MSLLKLVFVILAIASRSNASIGPHFDLAPIPGAYGPPTVFPPPVLPSPLFPAAPAFHPAPTAPLWPGPILPAPAPLWPTPVLPAPPPVWPEPTQFSYFPAPAPLAAAPLPPVLDPIPFAAPPTYRAIPGPVTKTHHVSLGFAHPVQIQATRVIAAPHIHPVKLIDGGHSHAHIHTHSSPLISLPHHHHQW